MSKEEALIFLINIFVVTVAALVAPKRYRKTVYAVAILVCSLAVIASLISISG